LLTHEADPACQAVDALLLYGTRYHYVTNADVPVEFEPILVRFEASESADALK
jgi:hypothetical protein